MKVLVVRDIERDDIEFISRVSHASPCCTINCFIQTLGCRPIASLDHFLPEHLGSSQLVEEVATGTSKVVKVLIILTTFKLYIHSS